MAEVLDFSRAKIKLYEEFRQIKSVCDIKKPLSLIGPLVLLCEQRLPKLKGRVKKQLVCEFIKKEVPEMSQEMDNVSDAIENVLSFTKSDFDGVHKKTLWKRVKMLFSKKW